MGKNMMVIGQFGYLMSYWKFDLRCWTL